MTTEAQEMPFSETAERHVLGCILLKNSCLDQTEGKILPGDFYLDSNRRIFSRMLAMTAEKKGIDYSTLADSLIQSKELESVGGCNYINHLGEVPRLSNIETYVNTVREKSLIRRFVYACESGARAGLDSDESANSTIARTLETMLSLQTGDNRGHSIQETADDVTVALRKQFDDPDSVDRYYFGLPLLNSITGGLLEEELCIIVGRTAGGKTAFMNQIIAANCRKGKAVRCDSLELSRHAMFKRLLCHISGVSNDIIVKRKLDPLPSERTKIELTAQEIAGWPLTLDDAERGVNVTELIARWRRSVRYEGVGLICVDYLQKVQAPYKSKIDRMTCVSEAIRGFAKDEKVRVIALSQAGRPDKKNENARMSMFDPKESGDIENDAHLLLGIQLPKDLETGLRTRQDEIHVLKQRDGEVASAPVEFFGETYTFKPRFA